MLSKLYLLSLRFVGDREYLHLMLLDGHGWVDVLELSWVVDELVERLSFQYAHAQSCWLLDFFDFVEHASLQMAHA